MNLNIVTALHCEAKPVIEHLQLKKITTPALPFPIFTNKENSVHLIISGVGKIKAAIATTFLAQWTENKNHACFLNIGIAGSAQFNIGEMLLINKISEVSTQRNWYPYTSHLKFKNKSVLMTHDLPQNSYPSAGLVDMEGSGFYQAAACFATQEQVQIAKIISDNHVDHMQQLNEEKVKKLISGNLHLISDLITQLLQLSQQEDVINKEPETLKEFLSTWHFTHAEELQLREYLRRWCLQIKSENSFIYCQSEKNAKQVIQKIIEKLDQHANSLY